jgi:hypothetical protein
VLGLRWSDLYEASHAKPAPVVVPRTPFEAVRLAILAEGWRQAWARPGVLDLYAASDALKAADRLRARIRVETAEAWERLAEAATLTTEAERLAELVTCS